MNISKKMRTPKIMKILFLITLNTALLKISPKNITSENIFALPKDWNYVALYSSTNKHPTYQNKLYQNNFYDAYSIRNSSNDNNIFNYNVDIPNRNEDYKINLNTTLLQNNELKNKINTFIDKYNEIVDEQDTYNEDLKNKIMELKHLATKIPSSGNLRIIFNRLAFNLEEHISTKNRLRELADSNDELDTKIGKIDSYNKNTALFNLTDIKKQNLTYEFFIKTLTKGINEKKALMDELNNHLNILKNEYDTLFKNYEFLRNRTLDLDSKTTEILNQDFYKMHVVNPSLLNQKLTDTLNSTTSAMDDLNSYMQNYNIYKTDYFRSHFSDGTIKMLFGDFLEKANTLNDKLTDIIGKEAVVPNRPLEKYLQRLKDIIQFIEELNSFITSYSGVESNDEYITNIKFLKQNFKILKNTILNTLSSNITYDENGKILKSDEEDQHNLNEVRDKEDLEDENNERLSEIINNLENLRAETLEFIEGLNYNFYELERRREKNNRKIVQKKDVILNIKKDDTSNIKREKSMEYKKIEDLKEELNEIISNSSPKNVQKKFNKINFSKSGNEKLQEIRDLQTQIEKMNADSTAKLAIMTNEYKSTKSPIQIIKKNSSENLLNTNLNKNKNDNQPLHENFFTFSSENDILNKNQTNAVLEKADDYLKNREENRLKKEINKYYELKKEIAKNTSVNFNPTNYYLNRNQTNVVLEKADDYLKNREENRLKKELKQFDKNMNYNHPIMSNASINFNPTNYYLNRNQTNVVLEKTNDYLKKREEEKSKKKLKQINEEIYNRQTANNITFNNNLNDNFKNYNNINNNYNNDINNNYSNNFNRTNDYIRNLNDRLNQYQNEVAQVNSKYGNNPNNNINTISFNYNNNINSSQAGYGDYKLNFDYSKNALPTLEEIKNKK